MKALTKDQYENVMGILKDEKAYNWSRYKQYEAKAIYIKTLEDEIKNFIKLKFGTEDFFNLELQEEIAVVGNCGYAVAAWK